MSALKEQVSELMVNQKHMLEAIIYLNEQIEDIVERVEAKDNQVVNIRESQVKNSDNIKMLKKRKEQNSH